MLKNTLKMPLQAIQPLSNDPWSAANAGSEHIKDNWMMSYIDVLTLLLTLLVLLLATQKIKSEPVATVTPPIQKYIQAAKVDSKESINQKPLSHDPQQNEVVDESAHELEDVADDWVSDQVVAIWESLYREEIHKIPLSPRSEIALLNEAIEKGGLGLLYNPDQKLIDRMALIESTDPDLALVLAKISGNDPVEVIREDRSVRIEFNDDLLFSSGEAELNNTGSTLLNKWVDLLRRQTGLIFVEGHTDDQLIATRRYPSNWELSASRAAAVTRYFIEHGIELNRLRAVGYAATRPRDTGNSPKARKRNRRVSIVIQT